MTALGLFLSGAPKLDLNFVATALEVYAQTQSFFKILNINPGFIAWLTIVIIIPLVISVITMFFYLISSCIRCCGIRNSMQAIQSNTPWKRKTCFWLQIVASIFGAIGCIILFVACFNPYISANGIIRDAREIVGTIRNSSIRSAASIDRFLGSIFYEEETELPFNPFSKAQTLNAGQRSDYADTLELNTSIFVPIFRILNSMATTTFAVLRPPVTEWQINQTEESLGFLSYLNSVSAEAPTFYSGLTTNLEDFLHNLTTYLQAPDVPYGANYFLTGYESTTLF